MPRRDAALLAAGLFATALMSGQPAQESPPAPAPAEDSAPGPLEIIRREAEIYFDDSKALFFAPFHWNGAQIRTAVGAGAL
ncbi:MAG: hypothetical protein ACRD00_04070, partial [Thermoanaerobaculia bacterium]